MTLHLILPRPLRGTSADMAAAIKTYKIPRNTNHTSYRQPKQLIHSKERSFILYKYTYTSEFKYQSFEAGWRIYKQ